MNTLHDILVPFHPELVAQRPIEVDLLAHFDMHQWQLSGARPTWPDAFTQVSIAPCGKKLIVVPDNRTQQWKNTNRVEAVNYTLTNTTTGKLATGTCWLHGLGDLQFNVKDIVVNLLPTDLRYVDVDFSVGNEALLDLVVVEIGALPKTGVTKVEFLADPAKARLHFSPEFCPNEGTALRTEFAVEATKNSARHRVKGLLVLKWKNFIELHNIA